MEYLDFSIETRGYSTEYLDFSIQTRGIGLA